MNAGPFVFAGKSLSERTCKLSDMVLMLIFGRCLFYCSVFCARTHGRSFIVPLAGLFSSCLTVSCTSISTQHFRLFSGRTFGIVAQFNTQKAETQLGDNVEKGTNWKKQGKAKQCWAMKCPDGAPSMLERMSRVTTR